jgi:hypothetical protein
MSVARLSLRTDFAAAGGLWLGWLDFTDGSLRTDLSGDDRLTVAVSRARFVEIGGDIGHVLGVHWAEGQVDECRIEDVAGDDGSATLELTALPVFMELSTEGLILQAQSWGVATQLAGELALSTWLATYLIPHPSAQRLGLVIGVIERDPVLAITLDAPTPAALLTTALAQAGLEREIVRTSDTVHTLNARIARGNSAPPLTVRRARNQAALAVAVRREEVATAVIPLGDADPTTGHRATLAHVRYVVSSIGGSGWVALTDPASGVSPIQIDTQWVGARVSLPNRTTVAILDSRASDGAVQLASVDGVAPGMRVGLTASDGGPLTEVYDTVALAARGRRAVPLPLAGLRGEANEIANGQFASGLTGWTAVNASTPPRFALLPRSAFGQSFGGLANGARTEATGTGTAFAVDGLSPSDRTIYRGDQLIIDGIVHTFTGDVVANTSGGITVGITPALAATYADDTPVTIVRREVRTLVKDGTVTLSAYLANPVLAMIDQQTDGWLYRGQQASGSPPRVFPGCSLIHDASGADFTGALRSWTYTNGVSGAGQFLTAGFEGSASAFTDGDTFTFTIPRETRTFRFSGTQSSAATSVTFKNVAALARRDWLDTDALYARRSISADAHITSLVHTGGSSFTATIDLALSSIDAIASGDRDGKARLGLVGNWVLTAENGSTFATALLDLTVASLSGSTLYLYGEPTTDVAGNLTAPLASGTWSVVDQYYVTDPASWDDDGRATLTIDVPAGRTIARGQPLWANWLGGAANAETNTPTLLFAHATVVGSASSLEVAGWDDYTADWDGTTTLPAAVYRLFSGSDASRFAFPGETLTCAATVQASGGAANVTLTAANAIAIPDNAAFTVTRPAMLRPTDSLDGFAVRLLGPVATFGITASTPALQSSSATILVGAGQTVPITAYATVSLSPGTYNTTNQPHLALVDDTGALLAWGRVADETVQAVSGPTIVRLMVQHTLTASRTVALRLIGGATDGALWHVGLDAMLCVTDRDDVPFVELSWANQLAQRAIDTLALRRNPVATVDLEVATLRRWSDAPPSAPDVVLGQTVLVPAYGLTRRVVSLDRSLKTGASRCTVGAVPTDLTRQMADLLSGISP